MTATMLRTHSQFLMDPIGTDSIVAFAICSFVTLGTPQRLVRFVPYVLLVIPIIIGLIPLYTVATVSRHRYPVYELQTDLAIILYLAFAYGSALGLIRRGGATYRIRDFIAFFDEQQHDRALHTQSRHQLL